MVANRADVSLVNYNVNGTSVTCEVKTKLTFRKAVCSIRVRESAFLKEKGMESVVEKRFIRVAGRYEYVSRVRWQPEDTEDALECFDFEADIASIATLWEAICRFRDFLQELEAMSEKDLSKAFKDADELMRGFVEVASPIVESVLPEFEAKFGEIPSATEARTALRQAKALSRACTEAELAPLRTPMEEWDG